MGVIKLSKRHALPDVGPGDFFAGTDVSHCVLCILCFQFVEAMATLKIENCIPGIQNAAISVISVYFGSPVPGTAKYQ